MQGRADFGNLERIAVESDIPHPVYRVDNKKLIPPFGVREATHHRGARVHVTIFIPHNLALLSRLTATHRNYR
jgi:hypothetical protein